MSYPYPWLRFNTTAAACDLGWDADEVISADEHEEVSQLDVSGGMSKEVMGEMAKDNFKLFRAGLPRLDFDPAVAPPAAVRAAIQTPKRPRRDISSDSSNSSSSEKGKATSSKGKSGRKAPKKSKAVSEDDSEEEAKSRAKSAKAPKKSKAVSEGDSEEEAKSRAKSAKASRKSKAGSEEDSEEVKKRKRKLAKKSRAPTPSSEDTSECSDSSSSSKDVAKKAKKAKKKRKTNKKNRKGSGRKGSQVKKIEKKPWVVGNMVLTNLKKAMSECEGWSGRLASQRSKTSQAMKEELDGAHATMVSLSAQLQRLVGEKNDNEDECRAISSSMSQVRPCAC